MAISYCDILAIRQKCHNVRDALYDLCMAQVLFMSGPTKCVLGWKPIFKWETNFTHFAPKSKVQNPKVQNPSAVAMLIRKGRRFSIHVFTHFFRVFALLFLAGFLKM